MTIIMKPAHICELCHTMFSRKENLHRHMNRLRKCNIATDFECEWCSKSFSTSSNLTRHLSACKAKRHHDELELMMHQESQATAAKLEELEAKYKLLEDKLNESVITNETTNAPITNGNHNATTTTTRSHNATNSNNTTNNNNNITINNYGSEDMSHMNLKRITFVFSKSFNSVVECVRLKHFSPLAPQNKNVCIKDLKSKYAYVFYDGNWDVIGRTKLIDEMYIDICDYIEEKLDELIDELDDRVVTHIKRFLEKRDEDKTIERIKTDLTSLIFNT